MIKECKKCGSKNLYLEPRIKGQDILSADMVALKCKDCGSWIKWCPKDERKYYFYNQTKKDKWLELKNWLKLRAEDNEQIDDSSDNRFEDMIILKKMNELEKNDVSN